MGRLTLAASPLAANGGVYAREFWVVADDWAVLWVGVVLNNALQSNFLCTLLYSTSKKGRVIENLYVRIKRGESQQNFNIWVYGSDKMVRGSGLFVGETGIATNHHFLLPTDTEAYEFKAGEYILEVYVRLIGDKENKLLHKTALSISSQEANQLKEGDKGIYFDWGPDSNRYHSHIDSRPPRGKDGMDVFLQEILKSK